MEQHPGADRRRFVSDNKEYLEWALGFISGANMLIALATPENFHQMGRLSPTGIDLWLRNYCNKNPNASFVDAVFAFTRSEGMIQGP
jgi:hypothetical protein